MDWLFQPLIFFALFAIVLSKECQVDVCSGRYKMAMEQAELSDPVPSHLYCEILQSYQRCMKSTGQACRGNIAYHGSEFVMKQLAANNCPDRGGSGAATGIKNKPHHGPPASTSSSPRPSCKYYGTHKFRHCGFFGDPHLKTFDGKYQTCRVHGTWMLIDNPYMAVQVTNRPVLVDSAVTAPTKITVVVKSRSTPCTLEMRYEADSEFPLPSTFVDGSDRPGADETVALRWSQNAAENRETVEIIMKYIATKLIIRRVGKYLAFSAMLPDDVLMTSRTGSRNPDDEDASAGAVAKVELCTAGCPAAEQLNIEAARAYVVSHEKAVSECQNTDNLGYEIKNNLTDSYLDWCVFDVMTAGMVYDFVAVAHSAQADALNIDPGSLRNRTVALELPSNRADGGNPSAAAPLLHPFQLPLLYLASLVCALTRYAL